LWKIKEKAARFLDLSIASDVQASDRPGHDLDTIPDAAWLLLIA
jgi:hypothetical protein